MHLFTIMKTGKWQMIIMVLAMLPPRQVYSIWNNSLRRKPKRHSHRGIKFSSTTPSSYSRQKFSNKVRKETYDQVSWHLVYGKIQLQMNSLAVQKECTNARTQGHKTLQTFLSAKMRWTPKGLPDMQARRALSRWWSNSKQNIITAIIIHNSVCVQTSCVLPVQHFLKPW